MATIIIDPLHSRQGEHYVFLTAVNIGLSTYVVCYKCDLKHRIGYRWKVRNIFQALALYERMLVR